MRVARSLKLFVRRGIDETGHVRVTVADFAICRSTNNRELGKVCPGDLLIAKEDAALLMPIRISPGMWRRSLARSFRRRPTTIGTGWRNGSERRVRAAAPILDAQTQSSGTQRLHPLGRRYVMALRLDRYAVCYENSVLVLCGVQAAVFSPTARRSASRSVTIR